jgi:hypothetical protein
MAEAAALASGIAGLLSLTITVIDISCGYMSKVNEASKSISMCLEELRCLKNLLNELDELAHSPATMDLFRDRAPALISIVNVGQCQDEINKLRLRLEGKNKGSLLSKYWNRLRWPFAEEEIRGIVERLHGYRDMFHTALSADGL